MHLGNAKSKLCDVSVVAVGLVDVCWWRFCCLVFVLFGVCALWCFWCLVYVGVCWCLVVLVGAGAAVNVFKCVWWWMVAVFRAVGVHRNPIGKFLLCLMDLSLLKLPQLALVLV